VTKIPSSGAVSIRTEGYPFMFTYRRDAFIHGVRMRSDTEVAWTADANVASQHIDWWNRLGQNATFDGRTYTYTLIGSSDATVNREIPEARLRWWAAAADGRGNYEVGCGDVALVSFKSAGPQGWSAKEAATLLAQTLNARQRAPQAIHDIPAPCPSPCPACDGSHVTRDGRVEWDARRAEWEVVEVYDGCRCEDCQMEFEG
jgi:hypothetical protein